MSKFLEINLASLPGPQDIHRKVFPNGMTVLTRSNFNSPSVVLSGMLGAGSLFDRTEKLGTAYFTSLMLMRGTHTADFQTIFDRLESSGASLGFAASVHNTNFGGKALVEDLPLLIGTLADCLRNPIFPEQYVSRVRSQILTGLAIRAQDTAEMSALTFDRMLFGDHPYGRPEDGFVETIQAIQQSDLVDFHRLHFGPQNLVIVVVGAVEAQEVFDQVEKALGDWINPQLEPLPQLPGLQTVSATQKQHVNIPGKSQTDLVMGTLGPRRGSPDYLAASLGNNILGQFGMMGRIGEVVREKA